MERKFSVIVYNCMARIGTALESYDDIGFLCEHVSDFALTFISPVSPYYCFYHFSFLLMNFLYSCIILHFF